MAIKSAQLREHLDSRCGDQKRVTVFWSCGNEILCTTGRVVDLFDDVLVVVGFTPTEQERLSGEGCADRNSLELITFISLERVCAVVAGVPHCRQACLPRCCGCHDHGGYDMESGGQAGT